MARPPFTDLFLPDQFYHVCNHAVGMENLFRNRDNYLYFLNRFRQYISDVCHCFAYCLMPNHFHFLVRIREEAEIDRFWKAYKPDQSDSPEVHYIVMNQLSRLLNGYTQAYNKRFGRRGALFLDDTKRKQVADQAYLQNLVAYIHHNPVPHSFCTNVQDWEFSSYRSLNSQAPGQTAPEALRVVFGSREGFEQAHLNDRFHNGILNEFEF